MNRDVDFVEDEDPGGRDEELPQHPSPVRDWRPRLERFVRGRYGLPVVVVIALLAFLVVRALRHDQPSSAKAAPSSTSGSTATLDPSTGRAVVALPRRTGTDPTRCPGLQCYTSSSVPDPVRAAVRARFPTATFTATETIRLVDRAHGNPLWFREVDARIGTATLTVRVQAHADGDASGGGSNDDGHQAITYIDAPLQQWFVLVRVADRSGAAEPFDQLSALVDDARLLQL